MNEEINEERYRKICRVNRWLMDWCYQQNFGGFDHGANSMIPSVTKSDGLHLSRKGKRTVAFFTHKTGGPQDNWPLELIKKDRETNNAPKFQDDTISELLQHMDLEKSVGQDGIHPRVMRELAEELTKPLSIIYQQSWLSGEVPDNWKLANVTPIYKKGCKEDLDNYRPVSLTSVPGRVMEQIILIAITQHLQDEGKPVDVVYLDFSKAFDTVSHRILLEKLATHSLDRSALCWVRSWLEGWTQRVLVNRVVSSWQLVTSGGVLQGEGADSELLIYLIYFGNAFRSFMITQLQYLTETSSLSQR
ncbi:hypothetical protein WISP_38069 [Willisornis vidua]|uniref:Reverse transcriptase domain-containing protein n=1 Tax=Willisornis vidua TaxID=1566151 RepID=A0ABQ9DII2_9PASS|nr:hypothetical protein WISP_38069 [Willisornis vidua]